jgi:hypothetical protein
MRKFNVGILIAGVALALIVGVLQVRRMQTAEYWREEAVNHPLRSDCAWKLALETPLEKRIAPATEELMDLLNKNDKAEQTHSNPKALSAAEYQEALLVAERAVKQIPESVAKKIRGSLHKLFLVKSLGSGGIFFDIITEKGNVAGGFIVLSTDLLLGRVDSYLSWKDSTAFRSERGYELAGTLGNTDDASSHFQYVLLHEIGHLLDWDGSPRSQPGRFSHPLNRREVPYTAGKNFFDFSWTFDGKHIHQVFPRDKKRLPDLFYFKSIFQGRNPSASLMPKYFEWIESSNFPTLYASTGPGEDFAESFATYVYGEILGHPWYLDVKENGKIIKKFGLCWKDLRCKEKRKFLEEILR